MEEMTKEEMQRFLNREAEKGTNEYEALKALADIVFVPSRGFLFFYPISYSPYKSRAIFIICGANIFKPSECYF